jgi:hypothetical protein
VDDLLQELNEIHAAADLRCNYDKTLALLRALKAGSVTLDNVTMTDNGWSVAAAESVPVPAEASTELPAEPPDETDVT